MPLEGFVSTFRKLPEAVRNRFLIGTRYRACFSTDPGKYVLDDLMRFCLMNQDVFVPGEPDTTNNNIGRRRVGLRIASFLGFDEREAMKYLQETKPASVDPGDTE